MKKTTSSQVIYYRPCLCGAKGLSIGNMPELPEVETVRRGLERLVLGRRIVSVDVRVPKMIRTRRKTFSLDLMGQSIEAVRRRGKYLIFDLGQQILIYLRMEGKYLALLRGRASQ